MAHLISSWSDGKVLPESYIFPPGERPGDELVVPVLKTIPIVDLAEGDDSRARKILEASQEFGVFLVTNHGVSRKLLDDAIGVFKEFFKLPAEEKSRFCSTDHDQKCIVYPGSIYYEKEKIHKWKDSVRLLCTPLEECIQHWPQKPVRYREVAGEYIVKMRELGSRILELICQGLGLEAGYFAGEMSQESTLVINYYPSCPDPSLTLGAGKHRDPILITILLQETIPGLQVFKDGEWLGVEPNPYAFVVFVGDQLQIVSNGKLRSLEHRVVTNRGEARTSAAFFIAPTKDCLIEPAKALVNPENPPLYRSVRYGEFFKSFFEVMGRGNGDVLEFYTTKA